MTDFEKIFRCLKEQIVAWFKTEFKKSGGKYAVIGISGGKDSTVVAAIAAEAIGPEHVIGVMLPDGMQQDIKDSEAVCEALGIRKLTINIQDITKLFAQNAGQIFSALDSKEQPQQNVMAMNIPPRVRMTQLRAIANLLPGGRLVNTSNYSEFYMGYFTKDGDSCGDIFPLLGLTVSEIQQLGLQFKQIPANLILKTPADGLTGHSDEEMLGTSYTNIDNFIYATEGSGGDCSDMATKDFEAIFNHVNVSRHKHIKGSIFYPHKAREEFMRMFTSTKES